VSGSATTTYLCSSCMEQVCAMLLSVGQRVRELRKINLFRRLHKIECKCTQFVQGYFSQTCTLYGIALLVGFAQVTLFNRGILHHIDMIILSAPLWSQSLAYHIIIIQWNLLCVILITISNVMLPEDSWSLNHYQPHNVRIKCCARTNNTIANNINSLVRYIVKEYVFKPKSCPLLRRVTAFASS